MGHAVIVNAANAAAKLNVLFLMMMLSFSFLTFVCGLAPVRSKGAKRARVTRTQ